MLSRTRRGFIQITNRGLSILEKNPSQINTRYLRQFPEFLEFSRGSEILTSVSNDLKDNEQTMINKTPEELLESSYQLIRNSLKSELLSRVKNCTPQFFERLVVELLVSMGYGGTIKEAGQAIGKSGDEGIDGIIKEDILGLDTIYIQAKRWQTMVGRPEIHKFAGALQGKKAKRGIFISTSDFSDHAIEFAESIENKIVLINGSELTEFMIDNNIGVKNMDSYIVKRIDLDFFEE